MSSGLSETQRSLPCSQRKKWKITNRNLFLDKLNVNQNVSHILACLILGSLACLVLVGQSDKLKKPAIPAQNLLD